MANDFVIVDATEPGILDIDDSPDSDLDITVSGARRAAPRGHGYASSVFKIRGGGRSVTAVRR